MLARWYVALTKVARERVASASVSAKGFVVYYPKYVVDIRHGRKAERVIRPLFRGYLFILAEHPGLDCGEINHANGVATRGLLCDLNGIPSTIPGDVIEQIKKRELAMRARAGDTDSGFRVGDSFFLTVGPFASLEAKYIGESRGEVSAVIELFGRPFIVQVPIEQMPTSPRRGSNLTS